jgi:phosphohistidine phosphatase
MVSQLWLLRHGDAEPHGTRPDPERALTERGEAQARSAGLSLAALEIGFTAVFTSPKVRARDTARLACAALGIEPIGHDPLFSGFSVADARELVLAGDGDGDALLVVGHNPDLAQVVCDLTGAHVDFKKGGVAGVRMHGSRGELIALLRPHELDRIGG